jgi:hypothetical protein
MAKWVTPNGAKAKEHEFAYFAEVSEQEARRGEAF